MVTWVFFGIFFSELIQTEVHHVRTLKVMHKVGVWSIRNITQQVGCSVWHHKERTSLRPHHPDKMFHFRWHTDLDWFSILRNRETVSKNIALFLFRAFERLILLCTRPKTPPNAPLTPSVRPTSFEYQNKVTEKRRKTKAKEKIKSRLA